MNTRIALMFQGSSTPHAIVFTMELACKIREIIEGSFGASVAIVEDYASDLESQWNDGYRVGAVESLG